MKIFFFPFPFYRSKKPHWKWTLGRDRAGFRELDQDVRGSRGFSRSCANSSVYVLAEAVRFGVWKGSGIFPDGRPKEKAD